MWFDIFAVFLAKGVCVFEREMGGGGGGGGKLKRMLYMKLNKEMDLFHYIAVKK